MSQPATLVQRPVYTPEALLRRFLHLFSPLHRRAAFFSAFFGGLLCHLYILTNMLPNSDSPFTFFRSQDLTSQGRWLLAWVCDLHSPAMLPWFTGLLSLVYLSVCAVLLAELFSLKNPFLAGLAGVMCAVFPTVGSSLTYIYMSDGFFAALFFSLAGVWCLRKDASGAAGWLWLALSAVFLGCSMGLYQAYFSVALVLFCLLPCLDLVTGRGPERPFPFFFSLIRMGLACLLGFAFYYGMLQWRLAASGQTLSSYQGISALSGSGFSLSPDWLLNQLYLVYRAWRDGLNYLFGELPAWAGSTLCARMLAVCWLSGGILLIWLIYSHRLWKSWWKLPCLLLLLCLVPLGVNIVSALTADVNYHTLMRYSALLPLLFLLAMVQTLPRTGHNLFAAWFPALPVLACALLCGGWSLHTNRGYLNMQYQYERTYSLIVRLTDRIQQTEGFSSDLPLMISNTYALTQDERELGDLTGMTGMNGVRLYEVYPFLQALYTWGGLQIDWASSDQIQAVWSSEEFQDMPAWPESGCTQVIDGVLVVKTAPTE